jgi:3-methylfumaryl-CoA hydratase
MTGWSAWVGRSETRHDLVTESLRARWCATLDRVLPADHSAPQGLHWCLCPPDAPTAALGRDGHPMRGDEDASFLPPLPLERRMWAAGKVEFLAPLASGEAVERRSRILSITEKQGASGPLIFLEVAHETLGAGTLAVRETQTLVYRDAAAQGLPPSPPPAGAERFDPADWNSVRTVIPGAALLFRYSALTFNSHRIHYDFPYATKAEGYRGLVVHGPLIATLLLDLVRRTLGSDTALATFDFRAVSPAIADEPLHLALRQIMAAKATPAPC